MKKGLSIIICFALICCFLFSGCTVLNLSNFSFSKFSSEVTENETLTIDKDENSSANNSLLKTQIAEKYIDISFTVLIAKDVKKVVKNGEEVVSEDESETFSSFGSGTIVYKGGYIVTNYHVIQNALSQATTTSVANRTTGEVTTTETSYKVYVSQDGGETKYEAYVVWSNINFDLAIIVCDHFASLNAAPMKDRSVYCSDEDRIKVLEEVITIGTQYDEENYASATTGTISSNLNRSVFGGDLSVNYEYLIQHDAPINHGSSGGALVDLDGNLIGVNTLGVDDANSIFYSVSIYPIIEIIDTVVKNWEVNGTETSDVIYGFKGIDKYLVKNTANYKGTKYEDFNQNGVIVNEVNSDCIIKNLKADDIIVEIDFGQTGYDFTINNTYDLLYARLCLHTYNTATVKVLRDGVTVELDLIKG